MLVLSRKVHKLTLLLAVKVKSYGINHKVMLTLCYFEVVQDLMDYDVPVLLFIYIQYIFPFQSKG